MGRFGIRSLWQDPAHVVVSHHGEVKSACRVVEDHVGKKSRRNKFRLRFRITVLFLYYTFHSACDASRVAIVLHLDRRFLSRCAGLDVLLIASMPIAPSAPGFVCVALYGYIVVYLCRLFLLPRPTLLGSLSGLTNQ